MSHFKKTPFDNIMPYMVIITKQSEELGITLDQNLTWEIHI